MNLDIQLAWCRHWVREQLGLSAHGAIVLFMEDRRACAKPLSRSALDAIGEIATEARWQFSKPLCILAAIANQSVPHASRIESSLYGVVDRQISVSNAPDLCGWIGAANSIFLISDVACDGQGKKATIKNSAQDPQSALVEGIVKICSGFKKPLNTIPKNNAPMGLANLDWERFHQPSINFETNSGGNASIDFSEAVEMIEGVLNGKGNASNMPTGNYNLRQAG